MDASVVVVGSCMIDLISYTKVLPKPGETIYGSSFTIGFGGKGANQCVAASRLGARTALVACVGKDTFGNDYLDHLSRSEINIEQVQAVDDVSSGVASIIVDSKGENAIVIVGGANNCLNPEMVKNAEALIERSGIVVCQGEVKEDATVAALTLARQHGVMTLMNAAPADPQLSSDVFRLSDIFCVNETEAEILTSVKINNSEEAKEACRVLKSKGCKEIIITLGPQGAFYFSDEEQRLIPAPEVSNVVDTTGAGDAFVGALAFFLTSNPSLSRPEMIARSSAIASLSVQKKGTQPSYPNYQQVQNILHP